MPGELCTVHVVNVVHIVKNGEKSEFRLTKDVVQIERLLKPDSACCSPPGFLSVRVDDQKETAAVLSSPS